MSPNPRSPSLDSLTSRNTDTNAPNTEHPTPNTQHRRSRDLLAEVNARVRTAIAREKIETLLVAVSGGADSTCLLKSLYSVAPNTVRVACLVDHRLRPESTSEADHVRSLCERLGVNLLVHEVDVRAEMARTGKSMETAARDVRYELLRAAATEVGASHIAMGHTSDDQVETVLMHEFRGAGLTGLGGMALLSDGLFRPLLTTTHEEAVAYCQALGLEYEEDPSNLDTRIRRNAVRHRMLPVIEEQYPGFREAVLRLSESSRRDGRFLDEVAREALEWIAPEGEIVPQLWLALHSSLRFWVLKMQAQVLGQPVGTKGLERVAAQLRERTCAVQPESRAFLCFQSEVEQSVDLAAPGATEIGGLRFECSLHVATDSLLRSIKLARKDEAYFDAGSLKGSIRSRCWRLGDRMRPLGMNGMKTLQDLFVDEHVPQPLRKRIPVFESESIIVWVVGIGVSDDARVSPATKWVAHVRALRRVSRQEPEGLSVSAGYGPEVTVVKRGQVPRRQPA